MASLLACRVALAATLFAAMPLAVSQQVGPAIAPTAPEAPLSMAALREGFLHPPPQARLRCYWWWLNGNTDAATITHDLEEMKAKGFGGALLVDANGAEQNGNRSVPAGPTFASPAWVALFTHALAEADRLGLEITLNITSGWNLGGPDVTPEQASKLLTYSRTEVTGGAPLNLTPPVPEQRNGFYRDIAVLAYPLAHGSAIAAQPSDAQGDRHTGNDPKRSTAASTTLRFRAAAAETGFSMPDASAMLNDGVHGSPAPFASDPGYADTSLASVQDLTARTTPDGTLHWTPPPGAWELLRIGYTDSGAKVSTASGAWQGLAIDYLSRSAFDHYWNHTVEPLLTAAKPFHSLRYLATDSWELGGTNWTAEFRGRFQQQRGYDPVPWLPVIAGRIVGDRTQSTRFLTDLRRTVADLIVTEHYDVFAEHARAHSLGIQAESGGPHGAPIDALETFRHAAVPQTEFWSQNPHRNTDVERFFTKEGASAANIYGQRLVAQEGETSIGPQWSESLATDLKPSFDMAVTEGMNRLVWHEFTSSPAKTSLPGQEYFAGTHLNPKVTWWNAGTAFFTYLNRVQFLMQQGTPVDDVLYFYGDNVPNFVRLKADDPAHVLPGYDYDVTDEDALLHTIHLEEPMLVGPSGVRWRLLALPHTRRVSLPVLQLVERFVQGGGTILGLPPISPTGMTSPALQARFDALVSRLWPSGCSSGGSFAYGQGHVLCGDDAHAALAALHALPDFDVLSPEGARPEAASNRGVDYIHRRSGTTDLYFIRNASESAIDLKAAFRVTGKSAEVWDAVTGEMHSAPSTDLRDGRATLNLHLAPFGSDVVLFSNAAAGTRPIPSVLSQMQTLPMDGAWTLAFQPERGGPPSPMPLAGFQSWTESADPRVRYFSGTATYTASIEAPKVAASDRVYLSLSQMHEIAQVRINGRDAGTVWALPFQLDVTGLLHPGKNRIDIAVTNLWPNRIIGDLQPYAAQHFTTTNITGYRRQSTLSPSGLIGPPQWIIVH